MSHSKESSIAVKKNAIAISKHLLFSVFVTVLV